MTDYSFCGLEADGLLLRGDIPRDQALKLAGESLGFVRTEEETRVRCALLVVGIEDLSTWNIPLLRWTYPEAVWLLEFGEGAFLAVKAHTPAYMVPALSLMDKYNTDRGAIALSKTGDTASVSVTAGNTAMSLALADTLEGDTRLIEKLWTRSRSGNYYRIPWGNNQPEDVCRMRCEVRENSLGSSVFGPDVRWEGNAIYFLNRRHDCAPAYADTPTEYLN